MGQPGKPRVGCQPRDSNCVASYNIFANDPQPTPNDYNTGDGLNTAGYFWNQSTPMAAMTRGWPPGLRRAFFLRLPLGRCSHATFTVPELLPQVAFQNWMRP